WGHARDFVEGMWLMMQQAQPDDYVLATGEMHSVREFVERAFGCIDRKASRRMRRDRKMMESCGNSTRFVPGSCSAVPGVPARP
ncbi:MAG TPA: GDP-mannose 4,6-dehydratase, partial [Hyphomicrobiaceae bacterium]